MQWWSAMLYFEIKMFSVILLSHHIMYVHSVIKNVQNTHQVLLEKSQVQSLAKRHCSVHPSEFKLTKNEISYHSSQNEPPDIVKKKHLPLWWCRQPDMFNVVGHNTRQKDGTRINVILYLLFNLHREKHEVNIQGYTSITRVTKGK